MALRATHSDAHNYLYFAKREGVIKDFRKVKVGNKTKYAITVPATRFAIYHDPEAVGEIVLGPREILAFTEGWWAAKGMNPTNRAGAPSYRLLDKQRREQDRARKAWEAAEDAEEEDDDMAVDITNQRELPETVDGTAEED
jgi:hypothetical protein